MGDIEQMPMVYALDAMGRLVHVDEVENGLACGCVCPDPACSQPLVARNAGRKVMHHFAHRRGSCSWSIEYLLALLAVRVISQHGRLGFPELTYRDHATHGRALVSRGLTLPVASVETCTLSGRRAPEVMVGVRSSNGGERRFALVLALVHPLSEDQLARIVHTCADVILVDLRRDMARRKRALGRHFDRLEVLHAYQDEAFLAAVLTRVDCPFKVWAHNARADVLERESEERERARAEAERQRLEERERRRREDEARHRERELASQDEVLVAREGADAGEPCEAGEGRGLPRSVREDLGALLGQQEVQARDARGRRWVRCERCGKVALEEEFSFYGGRGRMNLGTCRDCMRKGSPFTSEGGPDSS